MLLSIITINKNNSTGLKTTIESVISQSFKDFEYIIIDGNSSDESIEVIKKYSESINYWISESDTGIYNAMNKGIRISKGRYLQFLNSGDHFVNEKVLENIFRKPVTSDILYTDCYLSDKVQGIKQMIIPFQLDLLYLIDNSICHGGSFIKRGLFELVGNFSEDYKIISDTEFFIKAFIRRISFTKRDFASIVVESNGISRYNSRLIIEEKEKMLTRVLGSNYTEVYSHMRNFRNQLFFLTRSRIVRFLLKHKGNKYINILIKSF